MQQKDDEELYKDFLSGNDAAFNEIIKRYRKNLIVFIQKYIKDKDIAEDLSQDVFVYVIIHKQNYDFNYSFKKYLYIIAKSRAINYINKSKREVYLSESFEELTDNLELDDILINHTNKEEIEKAMLKLKEDYRTVIYLKDFEGLSYKDICERLSKPMPQVKVLLHRARISLKKILDKEGKLC